MKVFSSKRIALKVDVLQDMENTLFSGVSVHFQLGQCRVKRETDVHYFPSNELISSGPCSYNQRNLLSRVMARPMSLPKPEKCRYFFQGSKHAVGCNS